MRKVLHKWDVVVAFVSRPMSNRLRDLGLGLRGRFVATQIVALAFHIAVPYGFMLLGLPLNKANIGAAVSAGIWLVILVLSLALPSRFLR